MPYYDISTATDLLVTAEVLARLQTEADLTSTKIMVVGAAARDILISHVVGSPLSRATTDVDIAVAVSSWSELSRLTGRLDPARGTGHTYLVRGTEVDIIPFGDIEADDRTITWPNDHRMDVLGFREAFAAAVSVRLPAGATVAVASLPAQSMLKLFAWRDRRYDSIRDAIDLRAILYSCHEGPYFEQLYDDHADLLERHDFDPAAAGAERIGREAAALLAPEHRHAVTDLLDAEDRIDRLVGDMGGLPGVNRELLSAYRAGFGTDPAT